MSNEADEAAEKLAEAMRKTLAGENFEKFANDFVAFKKAVQAQRRKSKSVAGASGPDVLEALKQDKFDILKLIGKAWGKEFSDWYACLKDLDDALDAIEKEIVDGDKKEDGGPDWELVRGMTEGAQKNAAELGKMLSN